MDLQRVFRAHGARYGNQYVFNNTLLNLYYSRQYGIDQGFYAYPISEYKTQQVFCCEKKTGFRAGKLSHNKT
jgi:hypothetical protein